MEDSIILICHTGRMPDKKRIDPGPIGTAVAANIEGLRESQNLSYAELSRRLTELGRPIAPLGLTRIRDHQRRVDVDDLVALALALDVSPVTLLLPGASAKGSAPVTEGGEDYPRRQIWRWLIAESPVDVPNSIHPPRSVARFRLRAIPDGAGDIVEDIVTRLVDVEQLRKIKGLLENTKSQGKDDDGHD
jgi:transcriptional regulator with XRE-family HTH domain